MPEWLEELLYNTSKLLMGHAHNTVLNNKDIYIDYNVHYRPNEPFESIALASYLLPRSLQRKKFLELGYIDGFPGDYGLVRKAVGDNNFPIFLTAPDVIPRDKLVPIGNNTSFVHHIPMSTILTHANNYPSAFYIDSNYNVYRKDWDLNDYGNSSGRAGILYGGIKQLAANLLDIVGSPVVVTTGFLPVLKGGDKFSLPVEELYTLYDLYEEGNPMALKFILDKGLVPYYEQVPSGLSTNTTKLTMFTLPELTVTKNRNE